MKKYLISLILSLVTLLPAWGNEGAGHEPLEIKTYRFNRHSQLDFERLVLEFKGKSNGVPSIRLAPSASGKETVIYVDRVSLVGAIPEASINDSYTNKSEYIGPISLNTDSGSGFAVRTFVKGNNSIVDAFWLQNPNRLIVDVFPKNSERAAGPGVLLNRGLAAAPHHAKMGWSKKTGHGSSSSNDSVICFPMTAQMNPTIGYRPGDTSRGVAMNVEDNFAFNPKDAENVICYPRKAQVAPTVTFKNGNSPHVKFEVERPTEKVSSRFLHSPSQPPAQKTTWGSGTTEEAMNADADLALGTPEADFPRKTQSADINAFEDNFNKNNPPPSLGKQLGPKSPSLASPASLLPPLH